MRHLQRAFFVWLGLTLGASSAYLWRMMSLPALDTVVASARDDIGLHVLTAFLFIVNPSALVVLPALLFFLLRRRRRGSRASTHTDLVLL